ncbi:MAG TPA: hypothetical protein DEF45_09650 [Rhodopirellula sp.]|nr:MAG: hypothetical protein CBD74_05620 [Saprospirales bacterium TMED214]HBV63272.1 hypothetical protein [Rhodopirellula sp.]
MITTCAVPFAGPRFIDGASSNVYKDNDEAKSFVLHASQFILASQTLFPAMLGYFLAITMPLLAVFD